VSGPFFAAHANDPKGPANIVQKKVSGPFFTGAANIELLAYNALGQVKARTDRNQTVHDYTFDVVSRMTADAVTLAAGNPHNVDGRVQRLETAFDTAGRPFKFTSFDTKNKNTVVNEVEREFNGLGQLTAA
jgi:YD repeat-containing protein